MASRIRELGARRFRRWVRVGCVSWVPSGASQPAAVLALCTIGGVAISTNYCTPTPISLPRPLVAFPNMSLAPLLRPRQAQKPPRLQLRDRERRRDLNRKISRSSTSICLCARQSGQAVVHFFVAALFLLRDG